MVCDAVTALKRMEGKQETFHIVFMDPPYNQELELEVLKYLETSSLIDHSTLIIVEASLGTDMSAAVQMGYQIQKVKTYKTNEHIFLTKGEQSS